MTATINLMNNPFKDGYITRKEAAASSSIMDWEEFRDDSISLEHSSDYFHHLNCMSMYCVLTVHVRKYSVWIGREI